MPGASSRFALPLFLANVLTSLSCATLPAARESASSSPACIRSIRPAGRTFPASRPSSSIAIAGPSMRRPEETPGPNSHPCSRPHRPFICIPCPISVVARLDCLRHRPVRSRLLQSRSQLPSAAHAWTIFRAVAAPAPCNIPMPCFHSRAGRHSRSGASSAPPSKTSGSSCGVACGSAASSRPDFSRRTPRRAPAPLQPAPCCSAPMSLSAAARLPFRVIAN